MATPTTMFRKAALDHQSSPEQLDQMLSVSSMRSWLILLALLGTMATGMIWAFAGKVDTDVMGKGLIVRQGGVQSVVSMGTGQVETMPVSIGQYVAAGTVVATLRAPALQEQITAAQAEIAALEAQRASQQTLHRGSSRLSESDLDERRRVLEQDAKDLEAQKTTLRARVATQEGLLAKGLITRQEKAANEVQLQSLDAQEREKRAALDALQAQRFHAQNDEKPEDVQLAGRLAAARLRAASLERQVEREATVRSPYSGRVTELNAHAGAMVGSGEPLLTLQPDEGSLQVLVYVPAAQAKQITPGMEAQVSPTQLRREEYGYLRGTVQSVAAYPATQAALMDRLANPSLVGSLIAKEPVVEVRVALRTAADTASGFRWSSPHGAQVTLAPGTVVTSDVVVKEQSPASLIVPYTRRQLGLR